MDTALTATPLVHAPSSLHAATTPAEAARLRALSPSDPDAIDIIKARLASLR